MQADLKKIIEDMGSGMILRPRAACLDGFDFSAQANSFAYCLPRTRNGPWTHVELGYPSSQRDELLPYADDPGNPTQSIYPKTPVHTVALLVLASGGRVPNGNCGDGPSKKQTKKQSSAPPPPLAVKTKGCSAAKAESLLFDWAQRAVLGTPEEEMGARFEFVDKNGGVDLDWNGVCAAVLSAGLTNPSEGFKPQAAKVMEMIAMETGVAKAPSNARKPKTRRSL